MGRKLKTALNLLHSHLRARVLQKQLKQKIGCDQGIKLGNFRPDTPWLPAVLSSPSSAILPLMFYWKMGSVQHDTWITSGCPAMTTIPTAWDVAPSLGKVQRQATPHCSDNTSPEQDSGKGEPEVLAILFCVELPGCKDLFCAAYLNSLKLSFHHI